MVVLAGFLQPPFVFIKIASIISTDCLIYNDFTNKEKMVGINRRGVKMEIGKIISELRKEKGVTQESLAEVVGVSSQAVSKWESGGSPDIEQLPAIANYFGVTIDSLFGKKSRNTHDEIVDEVVAYVRSFDSIEERFNKVFDLCWLLELAIMGKKVTDDEKHLGGFLRKNESYTNGERNYGHSQMLLKNGSSSFSLDETLRYFFIISKPEYGWGRRLHFKEAYVQLFAWLADADFLKTLFFFYTRVNKPFTLKFVEKELGFTTEKAEEIINKLIEYKFVVFKETELEEGTQVIYEFEMLFSLVPFLTFAEEIIKRPTSFYCLCGDEKNNSFLQ